MRDYIRERVLQEANYIVVTGATIRETANKFKVSKSTVHKDLRERLPELNMVLYNIVDSILNFNNDIKHIRGGEANKRKIEGTKEVVHW
jgi:putative DeoR family transcriptional regulator (stage III sporulation protein D)